MKPLARGARAKSDPLPVVGLPAFILTHIEEAYKNDN